MAKKKTYEKPAVTFPMVFETYRPIGNWERIQWEQSNAPSCGNGVVSIRRYRVTVEEIDEPVEVLEKRLQDLWDHCDNMHHYEPLQAAAANIGYKFVGSRGSKRKKK